MPVHFLDMLGFNLHIVACFCSSEEVTIRLQHRLISAQSMLNLKQMLIAHQLMRASE